MKREMIGVATAAAIATGLLGCTRPQASGADSATVPATGGAATPADSVVPPDAVYPATVGSTTGGGAVPPGGTPGRAGKDPAYPAGPGGGAPSGDAAERDTLRGTIAEVGSHPVTSIVLRPPGGRGVTIVGDLAREIGRAAGAEVWVSGRRTPAGIVADRYAVRSVDGQPAMDGTLAREGDALFLVTPGGRRRLARPPEALRGMTGARVWIVGDPDAGITSYGVLREAGSN